MQGGSQFQNHIPKKRAYFKNIQSCSIVFLRNVYYCSKNIKTLWNLRMVLTVILQLSVRVLFLMKNKHFNVTGWKKNTYVTWTDIESFCFYVFILYTIVQRTATVWRLILWLQTVAVLVKCLKRKCPYAHRLKVVFTLWA